MIVGAGRILTAVKERPWQRAIDRVSDRVNPNLIEHIWHHAADTTEARLMNTVTWTVRDSIQLLVYPTHSD